MSRGDKILSSLLCVLSRGKIMCDYIIFDNDWVAVASTYVIIGAPRVVQEAGWVAHGEVNET